MSPSHCKLEFPCQNTNVLTRFEPAAERKIKTPCKVLACQRKVRLCRSLLVFLEGFSQSVRKIIFFLMYSTWISKRLLATSPAFLREDHLQGRGGNGLLKGITAQQKGSKEWQFLVPFHSKGKWNFAEKSVPIGAAQCVTG